MGWNLDLELDLIGSMDVGGRSELRLGLGLGFGLGLGVGVGAMPQCQRTQKKA